MERDADTIFKKFKRLIFHRCELRPPSTSNIVFTEHIKTALGSYQHGICVIPNLSILNPAGQAKSTYPILQFGYSI